MKNLKQKLKNVGIGALTILFLTGCGYEKQIKDYSVSSKKALAEGNPVKAGQCIREAYHLIIKSGEKKLFNKYFSEIMLIIDPDSTGSVPIGYFGNEKGDTLGYARFTTPLFPRKGGKKVKVQIEKPKE